MKKKHPVSPACPCGSAIHYGLCCEKYLDCRQSAPTAEALMRSRYTAYTRLNAEYLLSTWHSSTRPTHLSFSKENSPTWIWLKIEETHEAEEQASVTFTAAYTLQGRAYKMHETSRFINEHGQWYYVDGDVSEKN